MFITILTLVLVFIFLIWVVFAFYKIAILVLVNLVITAMIALRIYHDKKEVMVYIASVIISLAIILAAKNAIESVSRFLSRFMVLKSVQILAFIFLIAQLLIFVQKKQ